MEKDKEKKEKDKEKEEKKKFHKKYLKSKEFKAVKEYVFSRDGNKCVVCGREDKLVCHHRCYKHLGEANLDEINDCVTLCQADHLAIHRQPINKYWFSIEHPRNQ